ncbi:hypothetical protein HGP14_34580 [Rhizobium sp. P32RR-XVIII]|uniref:hypothetical protein n=1 Tax=Rhizobium sp. P32RR-XVIII TaxID=2726738 RepID=UPI001456F532|nr:hypothetical protein [Rhizobium sp. P32RR-XVIII]NLS08312.1 hypothetical protein [Rhizobium sp. P32RR-XVIII]
MATVAKVNPHFLIADGPITFWKSGASDYSSYHIAIQGVDQRGLIVKMSENEAARLLEWLARHLEGAVRP